MALAKRVKADLGVVGSSTAPGSEVLGELVQPVTEPAVRGIVLVPGCPGHDLGDGAQDHGWFEHVDVALEARVRAVVAPRVTFRRDGRRTDTEGSITQGESLMVAVLNGNRIATLHEIGRYLAAGADPPEPTA